jgi:UPF0176 protein
MPYAVLALYQFVALPDHRHLREPLFALAAGLGLCGSILLAPEGINGTVAGTEAGIDMFLDAITRGPLFAGRLDALTLRRTSAPRKPFGRLKVRLKREIVTLGDPTVDPARRSGARVDPEHWNALIGDPDVVVIDTRNAFEVAMGSFDGALDPGLGKFSDFASFAHETLDPARHRKVALFCTGGIRCEKASAHLLDRGFDEVFQLQGGILAYLDVVPAAQSRWRGGCFVFDERVALGPGLVAATVEAELG